MLGPVLAEPAAVERARERAASWIDADLAGVLRLFAVEPIGERVGWVYEDRDALSAAALRLGDDVLPQRVALEIVAECAAILEPLVGVGRFHPGPGAEDVLLLPDGSVRIAGFVGPYARSPAHRDPRGVEDAAAVVWRLGVLLAELLTGTQPAPASDRGSHELMIRRLLVRIISRPGPMFPDRYRDWLSAMLAWDVDQRPVLARLAPGLRELAETLDGPRLPEHAARQVPELRRRALELKPIASPDPVSEPIPTDVATPAPAERTEEMPLGDLLEVDEITAISSDGDAPHRVPPPPERGTIPVQVGPPPEAVPRHRARLPYELFSADALARELTDDGPRRPVWGALVAAAVLLAVALLLAAYLWM